MRRRTSFELRGIKEISLRKEHATPQVRSPMLSYRLQASGQYHLPSSLNGSYYYQSLSSCVSSIISKKGKLQESKPRFRV